MSDKIIIIPEHIRRAHLYEQEFHCQTHAVWIVQPLSKRDPLSISLNSALALNVGKLKVEQVRCLHMYGISPGEWFSLSYK